VTHHRHREELEMTAEKHDKRIQQEIEFELRWMPGVEPGRVGVSVEAGVVTLTGHVADVSARQAAEQLARRMLGVRAVANEIQIRRPSNDSQHDVSLVRAVVDAFGRGRHTLN
jgi:osmotically-inducible protein OsmY